MVVKEKYCMQNCCASDPMSVPSSLLQAPTHRVTSPTEELFPSPLADSGEELAAERLISGMENCCWWACPSTVRRRQKLAVSGGGISLLERSKVISQMGLFSLVFLLSFKYMDTKIFRQRCGRSGCTLSLASQSQVHIWSGAGQPAKSMAHVYSMHVTTVQQLQHHWETSDFPQKTSIADQPMSSKPGPPQKY